MCRPDDFPPYDEERELSSEDLDDEEIELLTEEEDQDE